MGGFSCAPRCPASLTFRDSPALSRQEGVTTTPYARLHHTPSPTAHSSLVIFLDNLFFGMRRERFL